MASTCECHKGYAVTRSVKAPKCGSPEANSVLIGRMDWCYACGKPKDKPDAAK